jgi:hypothetical protein
VEGRGKTLHHFLKVMVTIQSCKKEKKTAKPKKVDKLKLDFFSSLFDFAVKNSSLTKLNYGLCANIL